MSSFFKSLFSKKSAEPDSPAKKPRNSKRHQSLAQSERSGRELAFASHVTEEAGLGAIEFAVHKGADRRGFGSSGNSLIIFQSVEQEIHLFGVLSPHGFSGKEISAVLVAFFQNYMGERAKGLARLEQPRQVEAFLLDMVARADHELNTNGIDLNFSGTSLTCLLLVRRTAFVAWLGNARAVLYREVEEARRFALELTADHTPDSKEERYRVFRHGGVVQRVAALGKEVGPLRVWEGRIENGPGLPITRSLGDVKALKLGVISEPEVQHFAIRQWDKFLVIASENVWALIHSTQMVYYIKKLLEERPDYFEKSARFIAKKLKKKWSEAELDPEFDLRMDKSTFDCEDIAIIIVKLNDLPIKNR